jgi:chromosome segregation ATPase
MTHFTLTLTDMGDDVPPVQRLKQALKAFRRRYRFRCTRATEESLVETTPDRQRAARDYAEQALTTQDRLEQEVRTLQDAHEHLLRRNVALGAQVQRLEEESARLLAANEGLRRDLVQLMQECEAVKLHAARLSRAVAEGEQE